MAKWFFEKNYFNLDIWALTKGRPYFSRHLELLPPPSSWRKPGSASFNQIPSQACLPAGRPGMTEKIKISIFVLFLGTWSLFEFWNLELGIYIFTRFSSLFLPTLTILGAAGHIPGLLQKRFFLLIPE